jgi:glycosyltransferase involved in cell wall biosynthesis
MKKIASGYHVDDLKFIISGHWYSRELLRSIQTAVSSIELDKVTEFKENITEPTLRKMYRSSRVWVHPVKEAFGMGALEAASASCPPIIPWGSGVMDLFKHGESGYFPREFQINEYYEYIFRLLSNDEHAENMGRNAWSVAKNLTWDVHARKVVDALYSIVKVNRRI